METPTLGESWVKWTVALVYFIFVLLSFQEGLLKTQTALCVSHSVNFLHDSEGFYDNAYTIFMKLQYNTYRYLPFFLILMNYGDSSYLNPALASFLMWSFTLFSTAIAGLAAYGHTNPDTGPEQPPLCHFLGCFLPFFRCCAFCSFYQLLQCMMDHKVVREINVQAHAHINTTETYWNSCSKQNKLPLCSMWGGGEGRKKKSKKSG